MEGREYVEYLLKNYHAIKQEIDLLRLELEHFEGISPEEAIDALTFAQPEGDRVQTSGPSDKTGRIALVYRQVAQRLNRASIDEIKCQIKANEFELMRLEYCIDCLESKLRDVVKAVYIDRRSWCEICADLYITEKTLNKYRKKAIDEIADMFEHRKLVV